MIQTEGLSLLDYAGDVAKADTGPMNVGRPQTNKVTLYNLLKGPLEGPHFKSGPVIPRHCRFLSGQLEDPLPIVKTNG